MIDVNTLVGSLWVMALLFPGSPLPERLFGRENAKHPAITIAGTLAAILTALHVYVKWSLEAPSIEHLQFFVVQFAVMASLISFLRSSNKVKTLIPLYAFTPLGLLSGYLAFN